MGDNTDCFCYSEKDAAILTESNHTLTVLYLRNQMILGSVKTTVKLKLLVFSLFFEKITLRLTLPVRSPDRIFVMKTIQ